MRLSYVMSLLAFLAVLPSAKAVTIQTSPVGNPGNAPDSVFGSFGAVPYRYNIGTYDVTNTQYAEFLNATATTLDPFGLYNANMGSNMNGGIVRSGQTSYAYEVKPGYANKPVVFVSWYDTIRFANWLTNGQGSSDTESGTYAITNGGLNSGSVALPSVTQRGVWAQSGPTHWLLPSEDEWYKAAYYKGGGPNSGYWRYPFRSDGGVDITSAPPPGGSLSSNFYDGSYAFTRSSTFDATQVYLTDVGAYTSAFSPYGAFDMGGNVWQWNEALIGSVPRGVRGGSWGGLLYYMDSEYRERFTDPKGEGPFTGFRVANVTSVPEPESLTLLFAAGIVLTIWRRFTSNRAKCCSADASEPS